MTKDNTLKDILSELLSQFLEKCADYVAKDPIRERNTLEFVFKNNRYSTDKQVSEKDYSEFMSRTLIRKTLGENVDFKHAQDIIASYENVKKFYAAGTDNLVEIFALNYVENTKSLKFTKKEFDAMFKSLVQFIKSGIRTVDYFTPLFNMSNPNMVTKKLLGGVVLSRISPWQFKIIKEHLVGRNGGTPPFMYNLTYVLESTVQHQSSPESEDKIASERFDNFVISALLFAPGDLTTGHIYRNFTKWTRNSSTFIRRNWRIGDRKYKVDVQFNRMWEFYKNYLKLNIDSKDWSFVRVAINRFMSSTYRDNLVDRMVDLNVSLECMFSSPGETSMKLANRCATLAGENNRKREEYWNFIKNEYKLRNNVLHGRSAESKVDLKTINELENIIRMCICKFLNMSQNISSKNLKDQNKLNKGKSMRDYILNEIDLGMLNSARMNVFVSNTHGVFSHTKK